MIFLSGGHFLPIQQANSESIFLKCTAKFEINRGELIKPDWETSYITVNLDGIMSSVFDNGLKKEGRTLIRRNTYIITQRDRRNKIKTKYTINAIHGNYVVKYPQSYRTLLGSCQKGKG
tara:strand:- start:153 stop:509 length:357 start_codon:yes stop_codon:yes gene_type:complete